MSVHICSICVDLNRQKEIVLGKWPSIFFDDGELYKLREICARVRQILAYETELRF